MTRKDYALIAASLVTTRQNAALDDSTYSMIVRGLALDMLRENPRFSFTQFYKACGLEVDNA